MNARRIDWEAIKRRMAKAQANLDFSLSFDEERRQVLLRKRAAYFAARRRDLAPGAARRVVMVFRLRKERYAVELGHLRQVVPLDGLVLVPGGPAGILGVMNLRGEVGTVWDLGRLLDLPEVEAPRGGHCIVLKTETEIALSVDYVDGIREIEIGDVTRRIAPGDVLSSRFLEALTEDGIHILDAKAIVEAIQHETGGLDGTHDGDGRRGATNG